MARKEIPERLSELNTAYERCRFKIDKAFETFFDLINEIKNDVLLDLDKKRDEQEDYYNNLYSAIDSKLGMVHDALGYGLNKFYLNSLVLQNV